jgi:hypothetical protein
MNAEIPFNVQEVFESIQNRLKRLNVRNLEKFNDELLFLYIKNTESRLLLLKEQIKRNQIQLALKSTHELKSTSLNLSADFFGNKFNAIEALLTAGYYPRAGEALQEVEADFLKLKNLIAEINNERNN